MADDDNARPNDTPISDPERRWEWRSEGGSLRLILEEPRRWYDMSRRRWYCLIMASGVLGALLGALVLTIVVALFTN